jgi:hypothetical protein
MTPGKTLVLMVTTNLNVHFASGAHIIAVANSTSNGSHVNAKILALVRVI